MKKKILNIAFVISVFFSKTTAQTVNIGQMAILDGTVFTTESKFDNTINALLINDGVFLVMSDLNNDGEINFTPGYSGYTRFEGQQNQVISGISPVQFAKFYNVLFKNKSVQPAFLLSGDISISGSSDFNRGIVKTDEFSGLIVYENDAQHFNTSDQSHVDGFVQKNGNTDFLFPIGNKGHFRSAKVIPIQPSKSTDSYKAMYLLENSNTLYPHKSRVGNLLVIDDKEYWTIDKTSGDSKIMLTLSWDKETTASSMWSDLDPADSENQTLTIAHWDEGKKLWVDIGGILEFGSNGNTSGTVTSFFNTGSFGVFTLARVKRNNQAEGNIVVYNAVSPNGDGKNDYFNIDRIENYPNNHVEIFNQWGVKVFETANYNSNGNVFKGYSHGRTTISPNDKLPTGTYYYILTYEFTHSGITKNIEKAGFLYLNDN